MGFLLKSAIGLGAVYIAMFGQAVKPGDIAPTATLCAGAVQARLAADASLRARWSEAGCALKLASALQPALSPAPRPVPPPPEPPAAHGTLTQADLAEPWFGPARLARKSAKRG